MKTYLSMLAFAFVLGLSTSTAFAGGTWAERITYQPSSSTSLKVTEPDGFKVSVGDKRGTVPEIFPLANVDAFVVVTIEAPDGTVWTKKVEVRARQQTQVNVAFTAAKAEPKKADPKAEPRKLARNHMGRFVNGGKGCGKAWDRSIKADFRNPDGDAVKATVELAPGEYKDVEVPAGTYEVRVSFKDGAAWKFALTGKHAVTKDGWALGFGCKPGAKTPVLAGN